MNQRLYKINQIAHITCVAYLITETIAKHEDIQKKFVIFVNFSTVKYYHNHLISLNRSIKTTHTHTQPHKQLSVSHEVTTSQKLYRFIQNKVQQLIISFQSPRHCKPKQNKLCTHIRSVMTTKWLFDTNDPPTELGIQD